MSHVIGVENIKCGGCANGIKKKLTSIDGVQSVDVDVEAGVVSFELRDEESLGVILEKLKNKLHSMGYPEVGSVEGLEAVGSKAKSYVSCAIGKMTDSSSE